MAMPPQKFREIVFQILYSYDVTGSCGDELVPLLMKELSVSKKSVFEAFETANKIIAQRDEIDAAITRVSVSYAFSRIQSVERNILRLGVYEMLKDDAIPPKVAIAEALRLCRKFTSPEAASFVNAILDALYKQSQGESIAETPISSAIAALQQSEERAQKAAEEGLTKDDDDDKDLD